jgi:hypothetical protein
VFGLSESAATYVSLFHASGSTEASVQYPVPAAGTVQRLYARVEAAPGGSRSWVFTLRKNGASTALTCTIGSAATTCNNTTNTVAFAPGDLITVHVVKTGSGDPPNTDGFWTAQYAP